MTSAKEIEYIRLYKLAVETVSDESILPTRTDDEIKELISNAEWLIMLEKGEKKKNATNSPKPNIWIAIGDADDSSKNSDSPDEDLQEPGLRMGIYFNTIKAMRNAKNLLESHSAIQKKELLEVLSSLESSYKTRLRRKTKAYNFAQRPVYKTEYSFITNEIGEDEISELFRKSDMIESEGKLNKEMKKVVQEFPSLDLIYIKIENGDDDFKNKIRDIYAVYKIVRGIKSKKAHEKEDAEKANKKEEARQKDFREFINELNGMNLPPSQYIEQRTRWEKEHPLSSYEDAE
jgi:hypothetical protein